jgi:hypothetical protein
LQNLELHSQNLVPAIEVEMADLSVGCSQHHPLVVVDEPAPSLAVEGHALLDSAAQELHIEEPELLDDDNATQLFSSFAQLGASVAEFGACH